MKVTPFAVAFLLLSGAPTLAMPFLPMACTSPPFDDVAVNHPFCAWIREFKADQITNGCGPGTFCPDAPVTRAGVAALVERAMKGTASWDPWRGSYKRTLIVNPVMVGDPPMPDPIASGDRLWSLLNSIKDASDVNHYLLKIEPGTYDIGARFIVANPFVDIEGSGRHATTVQSDGTQSAVVRGGAGVFRSLTIRYTLPPGSDQYPMVVTAGTGTLRFEDVSLVSIGGSRLGTYAIHAEHSAIVDLDNVDVQAVDPSGSNLVWTIWSIDSTILMRGVRVLATGGSVAVAVRADKSIIRARDVEMLAQGAAAGHVGLALYGGSFEGAGVLMKISGTTGTYDEGLQTVDFAGQLPKAALQDSVIDVSGGDSGRGVMIYAGGDIEIRNSSVRGTSCSVSGPSALKIANTKLNGPVQGTPKCAGVYDANYTFFPNTCP